MAEMRPVSAYIRSIAARLRSRGRKKNDGAIRFAARPPTHSVSPIPISSKPTVWTSQSSVFGPVIHRNLNADQRPHAGQYIKGSLDTQDDAKQECPPQLTDSTASAHRMRTNGSESLIPPNTTANSRVCNDLLHNLHLLQIERRSPPLSLQQ